MAAAVYVQNELRKFEIEREKRDREFWVAAFGGDVPREDSEIALDVAEHQPPFPGTLLESDDVVIARSVLGRR